MKAKLIILAVISIGLMLRLWGAAGKTVISHDEAISYLGATANLGRYQALQEGSSPAGQWAATAEWQNYLTIQQPIFSSFQTITSDQAEFDIHPPLYFWLLHLWLRVWGLSPQAGPLLNIMFFLVGAPALYKLAAYLLHNQREAALVTLVWAASPAVLETSAEARQYDLLGVLAILFIFLLVICLNQERPAPTPYLLLLGCLAAVGNLTHYHFILVTIGGILVFGWPHLWQDGRFRPTRHLKIALAFVIVGYLFSFLLHPAFLTSFESLANRQVEEAAFFLTPLDVMRRIFAAVVTFTSFWVYGWPLQIALFILFLSAVAFAGLVFIRNRQRLFKAFGQINWRGAGAVLLFLWLGGISILMYLTFISPIHAMTARHMAAVWPFYAFLAVFLVRVVREKWPESWNSQYLAAGIAALMVFFGSLSIQQTNRQMENRIDGLDILENAPALLIDTIHRGVLPQLLIHLPPNKPVFAAWQQTLLENPGDWLSQLPDGALYLSEGAYGNSDAKHNEILALLGDQFNLIPIEENIPGMDQAYLVQKR